MTTTSTLESPHTIITGAPGIGKAVSRPPRSKHHFMLQEIPDLDAQALDLICRGCGKELDWWTWFESRNHTRSKECDCGKRVPWRFSRPLPAHQSAAVASPGYFQQTWYHATRTPNWAETVQAAEEGDLFVHAGSKLAALSRADDHSWSGINRAPLYLYSFELQPDAKFPTKVYDDFGEEWPMTVGEGLSLAPCPREDAPQLTNAWEFIDSKYSGAAYYNRYELPGEISLIFQAAVIDLATVKVSVLS